VKLAAPSPAEEGQNPLHRLLCQLNNFAMSIVELIIVEWIRQGLEVISPSFWLLLSCSLFFRHLLALW
tara:strand:- start:282 stop:485 length:204 start_codon:yes stop_codon:yes gene_type:complete